MTSVRWIDAKSEARRVGRVLAGHIVADPGYICYAEYRDGLSPDGVAWADDAAEKMADIFARDAVDGYPLAVLEDTDGRILAGAIVGFKDNGTERYAKIWDFVVAPEARGAGHAKVLLDHVLDEARRRGAVRVLLETSVGNDAARALFASRGFEPISTMHACRLTSA